MKFRVVAAVALALGIAGGLTAPAFAHATLESTDPPSGGVIAQSPGDVILRFSEQVAFQADSVEVYNSSGKRVDTGGTKHPKGDSHAADVSVPKNLANGGYVVTWRVISADSHPVHGAFTFVIGSGGATGLRNEAAQLLSKSAGDKTVGVIFGIARFVCFAAAAVFIGGLLFLLVIWPAGREDRRARRLVWAGFGVLVAGSAAAFALQGPYAEGLGLAEAAKLSVLRTVWHTRYGHAYAARFVLLAASGAFAAQILRRRETPRWLKPSAAAVGVALLATWGWADHAATGSLVLISLPFDVIHLGAAAIWVGGLAMTVLVVLPASRGDASGPTSPLRIAMPRFSQWALGAVIAISVTGVFAAWRQVGISWGALTTTPYGRLVIYKVLGLGVLIGLATVSRRAVHGDLSVPFVKPRAKSKPRATRAPALSKGPGAAAAEVDVGLVSRLRAAVGAEVAIALAVLAFSAFLVQAEPAKQAYAAPYSTEVKAGPDLVNLVVDPAKAGPLTIHTYILTADGASLDVPEVTATATNTGAGIVGLTIPLVRAGPGHFLTNAFDLPIRGTWTINVLVRTDAINEYRADPITVHVR